MMSGGTVYLNMFRCSLIIVQVLRVPTSVYIRMIPEARHCPHSSGFLEWLASRLNDIDDPFFGLGP
ncbi:hypothetical protein SCLCIDRAFT_179648 [Scleroderma citrinum Foug A]|uniref:Uncharacterized protein n=1 Tax=Scleroderma citrinum Foug A TaxID=1036808 RepID=A0A0C3E3B3_9AGAM|nr:hypothetical protein SCLCIDRAFT_179648 [Scleroderma citrinum Foug A]